MRSRSATVTYALALVLSATAVPAATYVNFESSQVHPIVLTPSGNRLLAVNTPMGALEVFTVALDGSLARERVIPVGLEPVSVRARSDSEAWVVNNLSDSVSVVDLTRGVVARTLKAGDEPTDVAFAAGRAFVTVAKEDAVKVYDLANLGAAPTVVALFGKDPRALAVSNDGTKVYAVVQNSGNKTTVVSRILVGSSQPQVDPTLLQQLGLSPFQCANTPPSYPPNPAGIVTDPSLAPLGPRPYLALIVKWNAGTQRWEDDAGQNWNTCVPYRLPDRDLFTINASTLAVTSVSGLGTTLFDVSVNPASGKIYVPHTEALNAVRFEHPLGVQSRLVENRLAIVDPAAGNQLTLVNLNAHIVPSSVPPGNLAERQASLSQAGMIAWEPDGARGWMPAIGSRKVFRVDGACLNAGCIVGPNRATPQAVEVGGGPTGVAVATARNRVYVLLRFDNAIAIVDRAAVTKLGQVALHDPSDPDVRLGRRFLYEAQDLSRHGDQACASCHVSGHNDGIAWDLGNPEELEVPYGRPGDNVRFFTPISGTDCPPALCAAHDGFDPRKGPMVTQTLRGMLEPLHWRGDRPTFAEFNPAFVKLMGSRDIGPVNGAPAGLSAVDMQQYRRFALGLRFPPNPYRDIDDTVANVVKTLPGHPISGNPKAGENVYFNAITDGNVGCKDCHQLPFGAAGGKLGGVEPSDPPSARAALINGDVVLSFHSDVKVAHLRNAYERMGPVFGTVASPPDRKNGFGFAHDGGLPDLGTFFSGLPFQMTAQQIRDVSMFVFHFPSGTKPAVGRQVTVAQGAPPTAPANVEAELSTLIALGDGADANRHCDLVAASVASGAVRTWRLQSGMWTPDAAGAPAVTTTALRTSATAELTFTCGTIGSGARLGLDWDEDGALNVDDCAAADAAAKLLPGAVTHLRPDPTTPGAFAWDDLAATVGSGVRYDMIGAQLSDLVTSGTSTAACIVKDLGAPSFSDGRPNPLPGQGYYYLARATNACGIGPSGASVPAACP